MYTCMYAQCEHNDLTKRSIISLNIYQFPVKDCAWDELYAVQLYQNMVALKVQNILLHTFSPTCGDQLMYMRGEATEGSS